MTDPNALLEVGNGAVISEYVQQQKSNPWPLLRATRKQGRDAGLETLQGLKNRIIEGLVRLKDEELMKALDRLT